MERDKKLRAGQEEKRQKDIGKKGKFIFKNHFAKL